ncbi:MAG: isochorismatase family protein [Bacteroidaceae bacterium]|nr:isochorismatase family protein [Bacteroidaceae bacterium]
MNKLLLVVDPQIDFISGSMAVEGAVQAMEGLATYIRERGDQYCYKIVTTDWHPYNHCSFTENGGVWPLHCVQNSIGAAIYPSLIEPLFTTGGILKFLRKGDNARIEELSIFKNIVSKLHLQMIIKMKNIQQIDLCGIAGDYCVIETLKDGCQLYDKNMFNMLMPFCASIDGGKTLTQYIINNNIKNTF